MSKVGIFNLIPAIEQIQYQTDGFGKDIEEILTRIRENYKKKEEIYDCKEKKELDKLIYKRTGILAGVEFNTNHYAAVDVPTINRNHVLIDNEYRKDYEAKNAIGLIEAIKKNKYKNTVNLKTAKLTGIFCDLPAMIVISGEEFMKKTLTPAQYTAVILHEIGHVFVSYEFISRTNSTNQVLAAVCRTVQDKDDDKTREIVFKEASELLKAKGDTITSLKDKRDLMLISTVILKSSIDNTLSENQISQYDASSFEQLADNFATRFGYGRELVNALDTIHKGDFLTPENTKLSYFIVFMIESLYLFANGVKTVMFFTTAGAMLASGAFVSLLINALVVSYFIRVFVTSGAQEADYTYDVLKVRHTRIKEQMVERLKDKSISDKERRSCLEGIAIAEKVIDDTLVYKGPMSIITNFIFPSNRKVVTAIELQRQLEEFASNDFFVKSAELQTLNV